jgi:hypothetical protein
VSTNDTATRRVTARDDVVSKVRATPLLPLPHGAAAVHRRSNCPAK